MAFKNACGKSPYRNRFVDVLGVDVVQGAVAPAVMGPAVHKPVFGLGMQEPLVGNRAVGGKP